MPKRGVNMRVLEEVMHALADVTRLRILALLTGGEVCVCHLHESLGLPQSKISRHLAYLRRAGLVKGRKQGLWVYYRLALRGEPVDTLTASVRHCLSHVEGIRKDQQRLEERTGCEPSTVAPMPVAGCCGPDALLLRSAMARAGTQREPNPTLSARLKRR
jgi:ArsR family transcriptional regulator, arsenate/arsenite/antimonite-responsive transcriptional repressor